MNIATGYEAAKFSPSLVCIGCIRIKGRNMRPCLMKLTNVLPNQAIALVLTLFELTRRTWVCPPNWPCTTMWLSP